MNRIAKILQRIGAYLLDALNNAYNFMLFSRIAFTSFFSKPFYLRILIKNIMEFGYYSIPIIALNSLFTGAVLVLQSYIALSRFNAIDAIPSIVALSNTRELAPVLTSLMFTAKVGATMAAEIGFMRVSEQIDALYTLRTNPMKYLVSTKVIAGVITLPLLVVVSDIIGIFGSYIVAIYKFDFNSYTYIQKTISFLRASDVLSGLTKSILFGIAISLISCYCGYNASNGADGIGKSTTNAVVISSVMILFLNFLATRITFF